MLQPRPSFHDMLPTCFSDLSRLLRMSKFLQDPYDSPYVTCVTYVTTCNTQNLQSNLFPMRPSRCLCDSSASHLSWTGHGQAWASSKPTAPHCTALEHNLWCHVVPCGANVGVSECTAGCRSLSDRCFMLVKFPCMVAWRGF